MTILRKKWVSWEELEEIQAGTWNPGPHHHDDLYYREGDSPTFEDITISTPSDIYALSHDSFADFEAGEHFTMLNEDDMVSDSDTEAATQQSIKAYVDAGGGGGTFLGLTDTPADYSGQAGKWVRVKDTEDELEFSSLGVPPSSKVSAYLNVTQENIVTDTNTKVSLDTENFDVDSDFDLVDSKFVAPKNGYYFVTGQIRWKDPVQNKHTYGYVAKNGIEIGDSIATSVVYYAGTFPSAHTNSVSQLVYLLENDELFLCCRHNGGVNTPDIMSGKSNTFLSIMEIF